MDYDTAPEFDDGTGGTDPRPSRPIVSASVLNAFMLIAPAQADTVDVYATFDNLTITFSDTTSHLDLSSIETHYIASLSSSTSPSSTDLFIETGSSLSSAAYSAQFAHGTLNSWTTPTSFGSSAAGLAPSDVQLSFDIETSIQGHLVLSPGATAKVSMDYDMSPIFDDGTVNAHQYIQADGGYSGYAFGDAGGAERKQGTYSLEFTNGGSSNQVNLFAFDASLSGYRMAPSVPEPQSWALALAGLGVIGLGAARRRRRTEQRPEPRC